MIAVSIFEIESIILSLHFKLVEDVSETIALFSKIKLVKIFTYWMQNAICHCVCLKGFHANDDTRLSYVDDYQYLHLELHWQLITGSGE